MSALLRMSAGLIVWAIAFSLLYGLHGLGCAHGWATIALGATSVHHAVLVAAWLGCIGLGIGVAAWVWRTRAETLVERIAWRLALIGIAATVVTGLPILTLPACL